MCFSQNYIDKIFLAYITPLNCNEMNASFSDTCWWVWEKRRRFTLSVEMPSIDLCTVTSTLSEVLEARFQNVLQCIHQEIK